MPSSKADHIAKKYGFVEGVASPAYLLAFDSADSILRDDATPICDPRYGWKRGRGGKCERVKPQKTTGLRQEAPSSMTPRKSNMGSLIAIGLGGLALGATTGVVVGGIMANNKTKKIQEDLAKGHAEELKNEVSRISKEREAEINKAKQAFHEEKLKTEEVFNKANADIESHKQQVKDLQKKTSELEKNNKTLLDDKKKIETDLQTAQEQLSELQQNGVSRDQIAAKEEEIQKASSLLMEKDKQIERFTKESDDLKAELERTQKSLDDSQSIREEEKKKFTELATSIDANEKDLKGLTAKVNEWKNSHAKLVKTTEEFDGVKKRVAELETQNKVLADAASKTGDQVESLKNERDTLSSELKAVRESTSVDTEANRRKITELENGITETTRQLEEARQERAKIEDQLRLTQNEMAKVGVESIKAQKALYEAQQKTQELTKSLQANTEEHQKKIEEIQARSKDDLAKAFAEQEAIYRQSPETFSRKKTRTGNYKFLSYNIEDGFSPKDIDDPNSDFWKAPDHLREKAVDNMISNVVDLEHDRIQAQVAGKIAKDIKEAPLAMGQLVAKEPIANLRKKKELDKLIEATKAIADPENTPSTTTGVGSEMNRWKGNIAAGGLAGDFWHPSSEDSPVPQMWENEAFIAEAKLRDLYVFKQSQQIKAEAKERIRQGIFDATTPEERAKSMKEEYAQMTKALKDLEETALSSRDDLFKAIKRDIQRRGDAMDKAKKNRCWEGFEPTPNKKPFEKGSCRPTSKKRQDGKDKGRAMAEEKIAKVMREYKEGKLKSSSGDPVKKRKQAIAIALSEAKRMKD